MKSAVFYTLFFVILCNYVSPRMIKSINSLFSSTVKTTKQMTLVVLKNVKCGKDNTCAILSVLFSVYKCFTVVN